jgi:uncharacterized repeat protein (TIGR01451 family)
MGNGRCSGESLGRTLEKDSGKNLLWVRALGGLVVLLVAGSVLLGLGSRRNTQKSVAQGPASPIPMLSRLSLKSKPEARAILGQLPLVFEPNQGQADPRAKFLSRGTGYSLFLDANTAVLAMQTAPPSSSSSSAAAQPRQQFVRMKLVGSNPAAALAGADPLPGKSNYMIGNDPQKWHTGIPQFGGVHYASVYPGIDLVFYGNQGHLEYDFRVAPGANASQAELGFDSASKLKLKLKVSGGDLILTSKDEGGLRLKAPNVYQRDGDRHVPVSGRFVLRAANRVGFEIGPYDRSRELIIDPLLDFSTYFGGHGTETSPSVAVNGDGNIYVVGSTTSLPSQFPLGTTAPVQLGTAPNVFVAKINPSQPPSVVYATFLGGSGGPGADTSVGIGVDNGGNAYIVGNTSSTDFPTFGIPYQTAPETKTQCALSPTCTSVFVSVLNPAGAALIYSSYLSGNGDDQASGMTIDTKGDVFLTGTTTSQDVPSITDAFPATYLPVPYQQQPKTSLQFFATEVNTRIPSVGSIAYSTYFGGATPAPVAANCGAPACNVGGGIAVDATGNMYFSGTTNFYNSGIGAFGDSGQSSDFPVLNAYQPCLDTPPPLVLTNPNQCAPPTTGATPYPTDGFMAKINPLGAVGLQLLFSTYLGGTGNDTAPAIAIDSGAANIYLTGETNSSDIVIPTGITPFQLCLDTPPVTPPNVPPCPTLASPAAFDAYVARMSNPTQNTSGTPVDVALTYYTYLGGAGNDSASAIAVLDSQSTTLNDVVLTGTTASTNFPTTTGALQTTLNGAQNAFFSQINTTTVVATNAGSFSTYLGGNGVDRGTGIAVDPNLNSYFVGDTTSGNVTVNGTLEGTFETQNALQTTLNGTRNAFVVKLGTGADLCITCVAPIISPLGEVSAGSQITVTFTVANEGPDPATNIQVSGNVPVAEGVTFNSATVSSGTCSAPSSNGVVCQIPTLQSGSLSTVTFTVTPNGICTSCSVTAMVSSANDTNTSNTATASFQAGGYTVSISPPSRTVAAGNPAVYAVSLSPQGTFPANVTLSCSALPSGAGCSFTSSTVAFSGGTGAASVSLNLTTTAQPETTISSTGWRHPVYAFWLMVPGMALLGLGANGKRGGKSGNGKSGKKISRLLGLLFLSVLFALVLLQPSCSTGKTQPTVSGTPSGTYSLTITATSGSFTESVPFSLTVIP